MLTHDFFLTDLKTINAIVRSIHTVSVPITPENYPVVHQTLPAQQPQEQNKEFRHQNMQP